MKYLSLLLFSLLLGACDTPKSNAVTRTTPVNEAAYVSPKVYTIKEPVESLPADSIPVSYSIKGVAEAPIGFNGMMGEWVAAYDEKEAVRFLPGKYVSYYNGEKIVEENMTYYQVCPDACTGGQGPEVPCFVLASNYEQMCFAVLRQTSDLLELSLLGANGALLTYHRKQAN
jgi:hypothetical protein